MPKPPKKQLLSELEALALSFDIKIRYEKTVARGGMCLHKGKQLIIIDRNAADDYKIGVIIDNIKKFDLKDRYINPNLREVIDNY